MADNIAGSRQVLRTGWDSSPQTGQQHINFDRNRARLLARARDTTGTGTVACTITVPAGQSVVITEITASSTANPSGTPTLTVIEDVGGANAYMVDVDTTNPDTNLDFQPGIKGQTVGKDVVATFNSGGTNKGTIAVYGWTE